MQHAVARSELGGPRIIVGVNVKEVPNQNLIALFSPLHLKKRVAYVPFVSHNIVLPMRKEISILGVVAVLGVGGGIGSGMLAWGGSDNEATPAAGAAGAFSGGMRCVRWGVGR